MIERLHSYPKVWTLGHPAIRELFNGPVVVQEKVDGSQFTFGMIDGLLRVRSKGREIHLPTTDKLFRGACDTATRLLHDGALVEGWQYRCEAMHAPKHNTLEYGRSPIGNVILFDVDRGLEDRISPDELKGVAGGLGLECVPVLFEGELEGVDHLKSLMESESVLGGPIEGLVVKNYGRWGQDGKMLMGKMVSESFKEKHTKSWKRSNPGRKDIVLELQQRYRHERRWEKAVERMRDSGDLTATPKDIGSLINGVVDDVREECRDEIADELFKAFWPLIRRGITAGLPQWYKDRLAASQFEGDAA